MKILPSFAPLLVNITRTSTRPPSVHSPNFVRRVKQEPRRLLIINQPTKRIRSREKLPTIFRQRCRRIFWRGRLIANSSNFAFTVCKVRRIGYQPSAPEDPSASLSEYRRQLFARANPLRWLIYYQQAPGLLLHAPHEVGRMDARWTCRRSGYIHQKRRETRQNLHRCRTADRWRTCLQELTLRVHGARTRPASMARRGTASSVPFFQEL